MVLDIFNSVVDFKNKIKFWFLVDVKPMIFALDPCMV
jgi:hypothetical protein